MRETAPLFKINMATLNELVYSIKNTINGGMSNRADKYPPRLIANWIRYYRAFLLKNDIKKNGAVNVGFEQALRCLTLTKADKAMCAEYCWGENVYYVEIPEIIELPDNMGLTYFGLVDMQTRIPLSDFSYGNYTNYNRFAPKKRMYAEMIKNTIYVHNVDDIYPLDGVSVRGVFADPADLSVCSSPNNPLVCFDWDKDCYPIPAGMEQTLIELIMSKEVGVATKVKADTKDDEVTTNAL